MIRSAPSHSWFRRLAPPVRITSIIVIVILIAGAGFWVYHKVSTCGPDVDLIDGQCIGITNGSVPLSPHLADVLDMIQQENDYVDSTGNAAVSVTYLLALPTPSTNEARDVAARHELEGAYLAQRRANRTDALGDRPLLRLLVANDGDRSAQWPRVVSALMDKVDGPQRLVAVVATGQTLTNRQAAIGALIDQHIPVISSQLTGDSLTPQPDTSPSVQGLARPAPSNSDEAAAAVAYLRPNTTRALLVQSVDQEDTYAQSLGDAFRSSFPDGTHTVINPIETYNPQLGGIPNTMRSMLVNICQQKPDAIFFAGRGSELKAFITALPSRPCQEVPINIMTGDSAVNFGSTLADQLAAGNTELRNGLEGNTSVRYTALAHPASWDKSPESFSPGAVKPFQDSCKNCFITLFPASPTDDGLAIMAYDSIVTAVTAIRLGQGINDQPKMIIQEFNRMHGPQAVAGASGWISFGEGGKPINKAVPIMEVKPDGTTEFVTLSAPLGEPCRPAVPELC